MNYKSSNDFDGWAKYYDIIYKSKYEQNKDYQFYRELLSQSDAKSLEISCGTGRLYLKALEDGHNVHGVDISEGMLNELEDRAHKRNLSPQVYKQDITELSLECKYDLIYYPFSSLCHIRGIQNQRDALENIAEHLEDGGTFAFDMPTPRLDYNERHMEFDREHVLHDQTEYTVEFWNEVTDRVHQEHRFQQRVINDETDEVEFETTFELSLLPKEQLELLLINAGFRNYDFYDGFEKQDLSEDTDRMTVIAEI